MYWDSMYCNSTIQKALQNLNDVRFIKQTAKRTQERVENWL